MKIVLINGNEISNISSPKVLPDKVTYNDEIGVTREIPLKEVEFITHHGAIPTLPRKKSKWLRFLDWLGTGFANMNVSIR